MLAKIASFGGEIPRTAPDKLPSQNSVQAINCRLTSGDLEAWRQPLLQQKIYGQAAPLSIYYYIPKSMWLTFAIDTNVVPSPIAQDQYGRIYLSDATNGARMCRSADISQDGLGRVTLATRPLGIPAPVGAATITGTGGSSSITVVRALVYTYVSDMGEEGPPSPPSAIVTMEQDDTLSVTGMSGDPGLPNHIVTQRLYVTSVGTTGAVYQWLADVPIANTSSGPYTIGSMTLGETLPSTYWVAPPAGLQGLVTISGNFFAGFVGNAVYFSEPNQPHAWPISYMLTFNFNVVGLAVDGNTLVVLTNAFVYLVTVQDPATATVTTWPDTVPCVSKRSIAATPSGSVFAGQDGLYLAGASGVTKLTQNQFTKPQWEALVPSTMHAGYQNGIYAFFYGTAGGYAFLPSETDGNLSEIGFYATCCAGVKPQDELALVYTNGDHVEISFWDADPALVMSYSWTSRLIVATEPVNFSCIRINCDTPVSVSSSTQTPPTNQGGAVGSSAVGMYPFGGDWSTSYFAAYNAAQSFSLTVNVYAGSQLALQYSTSVTDDQIIMLPSGFLERKWQVNLTGNIRVQQLVMATSVPETAIGPLLPGASI